MFEPSVRKIFVQTKKQQSISKTLQALLAFYQMLFGFNFGCTKVTNWKFQMATQRFSLTMGFIMISTLSLTFMVSPDAGIGHYWRLLSFVQYIPAFFILLSTKYTVCEFLSDMTVPESKRVSLVAWVYTSLMFMLKMVCAMLYCGMTTCENRTRMILQFSMHTPMLALDVIPVVSFLIFFHIYVHLRDLKRKLAHSEITLEQLEISYKTVADSFDKFRGGYDAMFVWGFMTDFPKLMLVIWNHLHSVKTFDSWLLKSATYVYAMHATVQICVPAVFAEMISAQVDEIKMILHERLLAKKEDSSRPSPYLRVLRYFKARPLLFKAWRLLALDLRLPTAMLSMCATYLIVMIQFTHLYD